MYVLLCCEHNTLLVTIAQLYDFNCTLKEKVLSGNPYLLALILSI